MGEHEFIELKRLYFRKICPDSFTSKKGDEIFFKVITESDPNHVLIVRNAANVRDKIDTDEISLTDHLTFLNSYDNRSRIDYILHDKATSMPIGGVNIVHTDLGLEIGKYIGDEKYLGRGIAKQATRTFLKYLSTYLPKGTVVLSKTKKSNMVNIRINQDLGFNIDRSHGNSFVIMRKYL